MPYRVWADVVRAAINDPLNGWPAGLGPINAISLTFEAEPAALFFDATIGDQSYGTSLRVGEHGLTQEMVDAGIAAGLAWTPED